MTKYISLYAYIYIHIYLDPQKGTTFCLIRFLLISPNERNFRNLGGNCQLHVSQRFLLIWPDLIYIYIYIYINTYTPTSVSRRACCPQLLQSMDLCQNPTMLATQNTRKNWRDIRGKMEIRGKIGGKFAERPKCVC